VEVMGNVTNENKMQMFSPPVCMKKSYYMQSNLNSNPTEPMDGLNPRQTVAGSRSHWSMWQYPTTAEMAEMATKPSLAIVRSIR